LTPCGSETPERISMKLGIYNHVAGVIIDDELKWTPHIEFILQKLKRLLGILYKMCYKLPDGA